MSPHHEFLLALGAYLGLIMALVAGANCLANAWEPRIQVIEPGTSD